MTIPTYINLTGTDIELHYVNGATILLPTTDSAVSTLPAPVDGVRLVLSYDVARALVAGLGGRSDVFCPDQGGRGDYSEREVDAVVIIRRPATDPCHPNVPYRCEPLRGVVGMVFVTPRTHTGPVSPSETYRLWQENQRVQNAVAGS